METWKPIARKLISRRIYANPPDDSRVRSQCWLYDGCRNPDGYGMMRIGKQTAYTHRISAACFKGFDLKSPLLVKHLCNNPPCFNPAHLDPDDHDGNNGDIVDDGNYRNFGAMPDTLVRQMIRTIRYRGWSIARWAIRNGVKYSTARNAYVGKTHFFVAFETHKKCDRYCQSYNPFRRSDVESVQGDTLEPEECKDEIPI